jgi:hypothetical protein
MGTTGAESGKRMEWQEFRYNPVQGRRDGRVAEGGGLLNRCTVKSCTGGSNPPLSASKIFILNRLRDGSGSMPIFKQFPENLD